MPTHVLMQASKRVVEQRHGGRGPVWRVIASAGAVTPAYNTQHSPNPPSNPLTPHPPVIWRFTDGKPGHEKQSLGLALALGRRVGAISHTIPVRRGWRQVADWLCGRFPQGRELPGPDLLLGAGHATHLPMLAARRARGGRAVVLMRPSLPLCLFDLCLIPEHDHPPRRGNVLATRGVLNAVTPPQGKDHGCGVILIGGPSSHFRWDSAAVIAQLRQIAANTPGLSWRLTTSRRTPADFLAMLSATPLPDVDILCHTDTPAGWLEQQLMRCALAWVTEDSVSMLYEALTAGCGVGLLRLPTQGRGRISTGVERLIEDGWVTPYEAWQESAALTPPYGHFDESGRCAQTILESLLARSFESASIDRDLAP